jgi:hypothetical protein
MKIKISNLYLLAFVTAFLFILTNCNKDREPLTLQDNSAVSSELKAGNAGPSANGQGTLLVGEDTRHFTFHANTMPDGTVKGNGVLTYIGGVIQVKFDVDCLNVLEDGMTAIMSGVVTYNSSDPEVVGENCWFKVTDYGEGQNTDEISLFYWAPDPQALEDCNTDMDVGMFPITGGNIQVK